MRFPRWTHYENKPWSVVPKTAYQNAAMELILNDDIDLVSIQSSAGYGKSYAAISCAFELVFQRKKFKKIFIIRPTVSLGNELGFLPGNLESKLDPYFRPIHDLVLKLHDIKAANRIFKKDMKEEE